MPGSLTHKLYVNVDLLVHILALALVTYRVARVGSIGSHDRSIHRVISSSMSSSQAQSYKHHHLARPLPFVFIFRLFLPNPNLPRLR